MGEVILSVLRVFGLLEQSGPRQRGIVWTIPNNRNSGRATRSLGRGGCHRKMEAVAAEVKVLGKTSAQRSGMWMDGEWYQESSREDSVLQQTK